MKANHWIGLGLLFAALVMISTAKADQSKPEISPEDQCGYLAAWTYAAAIAREDGIPKGMVLRFVGDASLATQQAIERAYEGEQGNPEQVRLEAFRECIQPDHSNN